MKPSRLLALASLGLTLSLGAPGIATAQEDTTTQKQDQQAPAAGDQAPAAGDQQAPQFGPRKKNGQKQGQAGQRQVILARGDHFHLGLTGRRLERGALLGAVER